MQTIKKYWYAKILLLLFLFFTGWWLYMTFFLPKSNVLYSYFGNFYGIIALWGAICGLILAKHWGGFMSVMGRAIIALSIGLFAQEFGQIAYSYYIFVLHVAIPYPSIGDIGFFGTIPCYIYSAYLIAKASGVKVSIRSFRRRLQAVIIPLIVLLLAYFTILKDYNLDFKNPLETFLNYGYPTGQAIYLSIALLCFFLTQNILGGVMKSRILLLVVAFFSQFLADYCFVIFKNSYYPGSILDYLYVLAYFLMAFGILELQTALMGIRERK